MVTLWYPIIAFACFPMAWTLSRLRATYSVRTLLLITAAFSVMFATMRFADVHHLLAIAFSLFAATISALLWTNRTKLWGQLRRLLAT